jgi:hypothetical protein
VPPERTWAPETTANVAEPPELTVSVPPLSTPPENTNIWAPDCTVVSTMVPPKPAPADTPASTVSPLIVTFPPWKYSELKASKSVGTLAGRRSSGARPTTKTPPLSTVRPSASPPR